MSPGLSLTTRSTPAAPAGHHVRSSDATGPKGARRPAGVLHAYDNNPNHHTTACGLSSHGLYWFGRIPFDPTLHGACRACIEALRQAA